MSRIATPIGMLSRAPERWTGRMTEVCSWCKLILGTKPCLSHQDGLVSDGICGDCLAKHFPRVAAKGKQ